MNEKKVGGIAIKLNYHVPARPLDSPLSFSHVKDIILLIKSVTTPVISMKLVAW